MTAAVSPEREKAGRTVTIGTKVEPEVRAAIEELAARDSRTVSAWVRLRLLELVRAEGLK